MSARQAVKEKGSDLEIQETVQIVCPFCKEDWERDQRPITWSPSRSCSVTRDEFGFLYHCFRASCKRGSGFISTIYVDNASSHVTKSQKLGKNFVPRLYPCVTRECSENESVYLEDSFEFSSETIKENGIVFSPDRASYVFPIRAWNGYDVGVVDRDFTGKREPKAITYWFNDVPKIHFTPIRGDTCIIVEDIPSAIKASRFLPAIALMGTSLGELELNLIRKLYSKVVLALDADAITTAIKIHKKYSFYFKEFHVLPLDKDIKDCTYNHLKLITFRNVEGYGKENTECSST